MNVLPEVGKAIVRTSLIVGMVAVLSSCGEDTESSGDMHERLEEIRKLTGSSDEMALDRLQELAGDKRLRVAKAAIRAIGARTSEDNRKRLEEIAKESDSGEVCGTAAAELGKFEERTLDLLVEILRDDKRPEARAGAARGLERLYNRSPKIKAAIGQEAKAAIMEALSDPDATIRGNAYKVIWAMTGMIFEFDVAADPKSEQQIENIEAIRKALDRNNRPQNPVDNH